MMQKVGDGAVAMEKEGPKGPAGRQAPEEGICAPTLMLMNILMIVCSRIGNLKV